MKNHIKNYIKIMGLAAVPFGTAQAGNYAIQVKDIKGQCVVYVYYNDLDGVNFFEDRVPLYSSSTFFFEYRIFDKDLCWKRCWAGFAAPRVYQDDEIGKLYVTDTKFSEGKSITRKDVEEQWQRDIGKFSFPGEGRTRTFRLGNDWSSREGDFFAVNHKMYDLPKDYAVMHLVSLLKEKEINFFLVKDKQRSFGGSEYALVVVIPDGCGTISVNSFVVPTVVCGGEVNGLVSSNEILDPSVRARLLSIFGQKELSVNHWAVVSDPQSKTDAPKVLLKDCPFVQRAEVIGQEFPGSQKGSLLFNIWERFPREFCLSAEKTYFAKPDIKRDYGIIPNKEYLYSVMLDVKDSFEKSVQKREKFSELLHRGANIMPFVILKLWQRTMPFAVLKI